MALLLGLFGYSVLVPAGETETLLRTADEYIIPAYHDLAVSTAQLHSEAQKFCKTPGGEALEALRAAFHAAMDDWQSIQHIRFGPVEFFLRGPRFQLWPDKRGTVGRHLTRLLAGADPAVLEAERFARGSVAVQGFSALELLLFGKEADWFDAGDAGRFRCAVVTAITRNLAQMAAGVEADWVEGEEAHRQYFASAAAGNAFYESTRDVQSKLLNNLHTQLQFIVEQKLDEPLGSSAAKANPRRAESWRSDRSLRNIRYNLRGLQALYRSAFAEQITGELAGTITEQFDEAFRQLEKIPMPLHTAVSDPVARQTVLDLRAQLNELQELFAGPVPQALDLSLGFNSLDGD